MAVWLQQINSMSLYTLLVWNKLFENKKVSLEYYYKKYLNHVWIIVAGLTKLSLHYPSVTIYPLK